MCLIVQDVLSAAAILSHSSFAGKWDLVFVSPDHSYLIAWRNLFPWNLSIVQYLHIALIVHSFSQLSHQLAAPFNEWGCNIADNILG